MYVPCTQNTNPNIEGPVMLAFKSNVCIENRDEPIHKEVFSFSFMNSNLVVV